MTGPLHGFRIVEMGGIGPAPFAGGLLGDFGADVVRIDRIPRPGAEPETPPRFDFYNRNKRSIALDLKQPAAVAAVLKLVGAIHSSPAWKRGHNAIVVVWDENDYSLAPNVNRVMTIVDTNYGFHQLQSGQFYTHFSLLKSLEAGFQLPCLNHACDATTNVMADLFAK